MTLPGFTAEASLDTRREPPHHTGSCMGWLARPLPLSEQGVIPQRIKLRTVHCACDSQTDICVCDDGRIFNDVLGLLDVVR
jgi:hypothetical protein